MNIAEKLKSRLTEGANGCLVWTGGLDSWGYGNIRVRGVCTKAHRLAWALANGRAVPKGKIILHSCDNPPCCEPSHLRLGTQADNVADMIEKGRGRGQRTTHCPRGHEYSEANTYVRPCGSRSCRTCRRLVQLKGFQGWSSQAQQPAQPA